VPACTSCDTLTVCASKQAQLAKAGSRARVLLHAGGGHGGFLFDSTFQVRRFSM